MDPFALVIVGGLVAMILFVLLLGKYAPGSGMEQLDWKSAREIHEKREALEADDLSEMIAAHNRRRRARGEAEVTVEDIEMRVNEDMNEQRRRREAYMADRELDELLELSNARRRARGLPERTREEVQREYGHKPEAPSAPDAGSEA
jgi:hypothetical protein